MSPSSFAMLSSLSDEECCNNRKLLAHCIFQLLRRLPPNNDFTPKRLSENYREAFSKLIKKTSHIESVKAYSSKESDVSTLIIYCSFSSGLVYQLFSSYLSNRNIPNIEKRNTNTNEYCSLFSVSLRGAITDPSAQNRSVANINNLLESFLSSCSHP